MNMEAPRSGTIKAARRSRYRFRGNGGVGDKALALLIFINATEDKLTWQISPTYHRDLQDRA